MFGEIAAAHKVNPTLMYGEARLASQKVIADPKDAWYDIDLHLPVPSAGVYLISGNVRLELSVGGSAVYGMIQLLLYHSDTGSFLNNGQMLGCIVNTGEANRQFGISFTHLVTVNSACYIALYALKTGSASAAEMTAAIDSDATGYTKLTYIKIG